MSNSKSVKPAASSASKRRVKAARRAVLILPLLLIAACRQDMQDQPRYKPLRHTTFFDDERSARPLVEGTVARGQLKEDALFFTGRTASAAQAGPAGASVGAIQTASVTGAQATPAPGAQGFADVFPFPVTREVVDRGEERFNIYCSVCHDRTGSGLGMVVRRGYRQPPSLHIDRLRQAPAGYLFDVITNGFGAMPDYSAQISPRDRWAIVAYVRALQLSRQATVDDVPEDQRSNIGTGQKQQGGQQR
jgi:mono/diheme cytochrome c family protein